MLVLQSSEFVSEIYVGGSINMVVFVSCPCSLGNELLSPSVVWSEEEPAAIMTTRCHHLGLL